MLNGLLGDNQTKSFIGKRKILTVSYTICTRCFNYIDIDNLVVQPCGATTKIQSSLSQI